MKMSSVWFGRSLSDWFHRLHGGQPHDETVKTWLLLVADSLLIIMTWHGVSHVWAHRHAFAHDVWSWVFVCCGLLLVLFGWWTWRAWQRNKQLGWMALRISPMPARLGAVMELAFDMNVAHTQQPFTATLVGTRGRFDDHKPDTTLWQQEVACTHRSTMTGEQVTCAFDLRDAAHLPASFQSGDDVCTWVLMIKGQVMHRVQPLPIQRVWSLDMRSAKT